MTSPEKLATPDPVIELIEKIAVEWDGCEYDAPGESLDIGDAIRRKGFPLAHALRLATQRQGEGEPFTDAEIKDFTSMIWGAPCHGKDLALVAVVVKAMEQMNPGERPKDPARGGRLLDWDSLPMDLLEQGAQPMLDKLTATSQGVAVAQPDAREAALEQAANLVECEYAADATQGRRLAQIAQHIRDLKKRKPL